MNHDVLGCILGSSYNETYVDRWELELEVVSTPFGDVELYRVHAIKERVVYVLFRHGITHAYLPNQIPYRAHIKALSMVGCKSLVVTSSVGVLDRKVPLNTLLWVEDILMPDNKLPDGSACTMFVEPQGGQGHLVLEEGLLSGALSAQLGEISARAGVEMAREGVVFAYVGGPRTKTRAENRFWAQVGAQVNSMTFGPEVVLANELEIACCGLVVGHKYSSGATTQNNNSPRPDIKGEQEVTRSLELSRQATDRVLFEVFRELKGVQFANHIYRFE